ncbi:MAG TPA: hypothetical protein GXX14_12225 [Clostridiaceae bacterium]|nr:hypothetical protein [Clostridiaceae bacterium]
MLDFLKKKFSKNLKEKVSFESKVLRKNDISLLILDERWNNIFRNIDKPPEIARGEEELTGLLKEQARLSDESKTIQAQKKEYMAKIIELTPEAFDKDNEDAKREMQFYEKEIKRINDRLKEIGDRLEKIPDLLKEANLKLLELAVNKVYFKIRESGKRIEELDKMIEETKIKLKEMISERETLAQGSSDVYSYFHDLLGKEELERLDKEYFR